MDTKTHASMDYDPQQLREGIARNQTAQVLEKLRLLTKDMPDVYDQVLLLGARFEDVQRKDMLGLIASSETAMANAQVNYGLLKIIGSYVPPSSSPGPTPVATVFISYNHTDAEAANLLKEKLTARNIHVLIDSEAMQAGEDIKTFIEHSVRDTETTISIISKRSLLSAWVAMETIQTFYHEKTNTKKKFIACYVEDDFFNHVFTDAALDVVEEKLHELETLKRARIEKGRNTRDLDNEYTRMKGLSNGLDEIIRRLRESLCIDIRNENLDRNLEKIIQRIQA